MTVGEVNRIRIVSIHADWLLALRAKKRLPKPWEQGLAKFAG